MPTAIPVVPQWTQRKPWLMASAAQFRPGPPPALDSAIWARDYNEVKAMGARKGSSRSAEQTDIARFWEATMPSIYHGVVRSVAERPGRDITQNARLFAAVAQGMDDALVAVFDAKYHYNFWRPITAIRNGDKDGNDATERDASWPPFIDTPMHPEYPCAHCIVSATVGTSSKRTSVTLRACTDDDQLPGRGLEAQLEIHRGLHRGSLRGAHLRRGALPQLDGGRFGDGPEGRRAGSKCVLRVPGMMLCLANDLAGIE